MGYGQVVLRLTMPKSPIPFPVDRPSLLRCVRTLVSLLYERVVGDGDGPGDNLPLPGGLSLDVVACSLIAHAAEIDSSAEILGQAPSIEDDMAEIVQLLRMLVAHAAPDGGGPSRN